MVKKKQKKNGGGGEMKKIKSIEFSFFFPSWAIKLAGEWMKYFAARENNLERNMGLIENYGIVLMSLLLS